MDFHAIIVCLQVAFYLVCKMMHIHNHAVASSLCQSSDDMFKQRRIPYPYQRLGHCVSKWFQAGSETGCKNHCLHWLLFYACKITFFISVCKGKDCINHKKKQRVTAGFPADDIFSVPVLYFHLSFFYLVAGMSVLYGNTIHLYNGKS